MTFTTSQKSVLILCFQKFPTEISFWQFGQASEPGFSIYVTFQVSRKMLLNNLSLWILLWNPIPKNKKKKKRNQ